MRALLKLAFFAALALAALGARAEEYGNLIDKGEFFIAKGVSYAPDAVRSLEEAAKLDPKKAGSDPRFVAAIAKAYISVSRLTEAWQWIETIERSGVSDGKVEALKDFLLKDAGVGRFRLGTAFEISDFSASLKPENEGRLDVAGRKILEKLNQFLSRKLRVGTEGLTLLMPEGRFTLTSSAPLGEEGVSNRQIEIWAGDEQEQALVAVYPPAGAWKVEPGNRTVSLSWPQAAGAAKYRLVRDPGREGRKVLHEGPERSWTDKEAAPGVTAAYRLYVYAEDGSLLSLSDVSATSLPPVTEVWAQSSLSGDLNVILAWQFGEGTMDRLIIRKIDRGEEKILVDQAGQEIMRSGELSDGPVALQEGPQSFTYAVEGWVEGESIPAASSASVLIPPQVARVDAVRENFLSDRVTVEWDTFPREGLAQGYAVYLVREPGGMGELVGKAEDAHARELSYVPTQGEPGPQWRHVVLPYIGDRYLVDLMPLKVADQFPQADMERRASRMRKVPDLMLSWRPYKDANRYLVRVGEKEFIARENYLELTGLQSNLMGTAHSVKVYARNPDGELILLLETQLVYQHYSSQ